MHQSHVVEFLAHLKDNQQIMPYNSETIATQVPIAICVIHFSFMHVKVYLHRNFTGNLENLKAIKYGIELCHL